MDLVEGFLKDLFCILGGSQRMKGQEPVPGRGVPGGGRGRRL